MGVVCRDWRVQDDSTDKEQGSSEEAAKVEVAMMQLREQIRKLLDRGYSLPFTGEASPVSPVFRRRLFYNSPHVLEQDLSASHATAGAARTNNSSHVLEQDSSASHATAGAARTNNSSHVLEQDSSALHATASSAWTDKGKERERDLTVAPGCADAVKDVLKQITEMHETLQPGQVHDLYHEAYMALLTFQIEDLTEKIGAITSAGTACIAQRSAALTGS